MCVDWLIGTSPLRQLPYWKGVVSVYVTEHGKRAQLTFKIILSFSAKLRLRSILGKTFLAAIQYLQQFTYLRVKF